MKKRIIFMGSPAFAVPALRRLFEAGHEIAAIYCQPPRPAGRGQNLQKTAVHEEAEKLGLGALVRTPERLKGADLEGVFAIKCDVICVVAYGLLLPEALVNARICLNVHPSALPRWRGAAPLQWTLLNGDKTSEICVMRLDKGMDTGPVIVRRAFEVGERVNCGELSVFCAGAGAEMLEAVVSQAGNEVSLYAGTPQTGDATLAPKITAAMRSLDWGRATKDLHNQVRGLAPTPGATAMLDGEALKVLKAEVADGAGAAGEIVAVDAAGVVVACGNGALRLLTVQRPGGKPLAAAELARGWEALRVGSIFK
jgi:methionyl-tRNA formyltransferase